MWRVAGAMKLVTALLAILVGCGEATIGPSMTKMLDVMAEMATAQPFDRGYLAEMDECWTRLAPGLDHDSELMWQAFYNYSQNQGARRPLHKGGDPWTPSTGCFRFHKPSSDRQPYMERNFSIIGNRDVHTLTSLTLLFVTLLKGGKLNISICEPCNFNSNLAFYRSTTRFCVREKKGMCDTYNKPGGCNPK